MMFTRALRREATAAAIAIAFSLPAAAQRMIPPPAPPPPPPPAMEKGACPTPVWPKSSLRNEETGTVTLSFLVGADGNVIDNKLLRSSGHPLLDEASLQNNRACRFSPLAAGAEPQWRSMQLVWQLNEAPASAAAGTPAPAPAAGVSYFRDLGRVVGQVRAADWTYDICAASGDGNKDANLAALNAWKASHHAVIDEVEAAFQGLPAYWAGSDPASAKAGPASWAKINAQLDEGRQFLATQYASQLGKERFVVICANLPKIFKGNAFDIEQRFATELASIRRGPR